eukprot:4142692-Pyramimonas_sp.AAC.1
MAVIKPLLEVNKTALMNYDACISNVDGFYNGLQAPNLHVSIRGRGVRMAKPMWRDVEKLRSKEGEGGLMMWTTDVSADRSHVFSFASNHARDSWAISSAR